MLSLARIITLVMDSMPTTVILQIGKKKQIDILLVVNMFLTGFDSKPLNTLYVDKNLKYHGLIQAFHGLTVSTMIKNHLEHH
jgi:hypothetical protein